MLKTQIIIFLIIGSFMILSAQPAKKVFINGKVFTVNNKQPLAEAVVVLGNKIMFVGSNADVRKMIDSSTKVIDLKGKLMLPGFIDDHTHFISGGFYLQGINLRHAKSVEEFKELIQQYAEIHKGKWITGGNWDHEAWENKELPTKEIIDGFTANTPVFVDRFDGHMALANSYALKLADITKDTPNPDGGLIVKNKMTGEPTGILKDNAMLLVSAVIPPPSAEEYYNACLTALNEARKNGITSIQDITLAKDLETFQKVERDGKLTCRIYTRLPINQYKNLVGTGIQYNFGGNMIKLGSLKAYADGSLGSSTAWFFKPYTQDTTTSGLPMEIVTNGNLKSWATDADKNKLQLSIHAIGDKANAWVLDLYEMIKNTNPEWDRRFRIEHAQHVHFEDIPRFKKIGVIASCQPYHLIDDGVWAEKRIGPERIKYSYPFKTFLENGVKLCFGSDWSVAPLNAIYGIYAAVTRRTLDGKNPNGWLPEQKISVEDAIKCYTINNAYAAFEERNKGLIETGKLADFVVLDKDILTIDPVKIKDVKVDMTILGGEIIFERN